MGKRLPRARETTRRREGEGEDELDKPASINHANPPPSLAPSKWPLCLPQCPKGKSLWPDRSKTMEEDLLTDARTSSVRPLPLSNIQLIVSPYKPII